MSNTISNRIFMSAIADGVTIHGALRANRTLTQKYDRNNNVGIPSWSNDNPSQNPFVYPVVYKGSALVVPDAMEWYYNGVKITWSAQSYSYNVGTNTPKQYYRSTNFTLSGRPMFLLGLNANGHAFNDGTGGSSVNLPKLIINADLAVYGAQQETIDIDSITFKGQVMMSNSAVDFSMTTNIMISEQTSQGYTGELNYSKMEVSGDTDSARITPMLYNDGPVDVFAVKWYTPDGEVTTTSSAQPIYLDGKDIVVTGAGVTDIIALRCEFYVPDASGALVDTKIGYIDDNKDDIYLWSSAVISGGTAANIAEVTLRKGQTVTYSFWVGKEPDNPGGAKDGNYSSFSVILYNAAKTAINKTAIASLSGQVQDSTTKAITLPFNTATRVASFAVTCEEIQAAGGNIEGIVIAQ